jgi:hypothetical protein
LFGLVVDDSSLFESVPDMGYRLDVVGEQAEFFAECGDVAAKRIFRDGLTFGRYGRRDAARRKGVVRL